jgi:two-component system sensor histidine kinase KdpD
MPEVWSVISEEGHVSHIQSLFLAEPKKVPPWKKFLFDSLLAPSSISLLTGLFLLFHLYPNVPDLFLAYLLVILALAGIRGIYAALIASFLAFFFFDFLFISPFYTLIVAKWEDVLALMVFLITTVLTSQLANVLRRRAEDASRRERGTRILYDVLRATNHEDHLQRQLAILAHSIVKVFSVWGVSDCLFLLPDGEKFLVLGGTKESVDYTELVSEVEQVATWVVEHGSPRDIIQEPVVYHKPNIPHFQQFLRRLTVQRVETVVLHYQRLIPLKTDQKIAGVLLLSIEEGQERIPFANGRVKEEELSSPQGVFLSAFVEHAAVLIERDRLRRESLHIEMLQRTDSLRAALLSSVSHDLRTPLSTIKTSVTSLLAKEVQWDDDARHVFACAIERECDRLNELIEKLLDMSRIEAGALQLEKVWYPLDELLDSVLARMQKQLQGRNVQIAIPDDLPPVEIDQVLIDQVVTNLLENAVTYTPAGSPIDIFACIMEEKYVKISIADRGPGIRPDEREYIFDKFYRVLTNATHPSSSRGSGLGLAICHAFVEAHGGHIWVEAREGNGAIFHFTLPLDTRGKCSFE